MQFKTHLNSTREAVMICHGFPAQPAVSATVEKNRDIAEELMRTGRYDAYVMHYSGLGSSAGSFSFVNSVIDSVEFALKLLDKFEYEKLHLVGHSWGGLVALNIYYRLPSHLRGRVVLLSPFTIFPSDEVLKSAILAINADTVIKYACGGVDEVVDELRVVEEKYSPINIVKELKSLGSNTTIIQAIEDDEVPVEFTRDFVKLFLITPKYIEIDTEHKFQRSRSHVIREIIRYIDGSAND